MAGNFKSQSHGSNAKPDLEDRAEKKSKGKKKSRGGNPFAKAMAKAK